MVVVPERTNKNIDSENIQSLLPSYEIKTRINYRVIRRFIRPHFFKI